jgi:hypothetical protein
MCNLARRVYIKDLLIFQSPIIYAMIDEYINKAKQHGVYIGELTMNSYIYESRSLDVSYLMNYIKSLSNLVSIFRDIYDNDLYNLSLHGIDNIIYDIDHFQIIFSAVNNTFNVYLDDQFLFEDFGTYQSKISLDTVMAMYESFNKNFTLSLKDIVPSNILKKISMSRNIKYLPYVYDRIFEQFESIYLPFY